MGIWTKVRDILGGNENLIRMVNNYTYNELGNIQTIYTHRYNAKELNVWHDDSYM